MMHDDSLGDSGFAVIRSNNIVHRQAAQTHFFNCPKSGLIAISAANY